MANSHLFNYGVRSTKLTSGVFMCAFLATFSIVGAVAFAALAFIFVTDQAQYIIAAILLMLFAVFLAVWRVGDLLEERPKA